MAVPLCTVGVSVDPPEDPLMDTGCPDGSFTTADADDCVPVALI